MDRVFDKDISAAMVTRWDGITEKILKLAKDAVNNIKVQEMLLFIDDQSSEGTYTYMYTYSKLLLSLLLETKFLVAFVCLYYLLPDTRSCQDHTKILSFFW